MAWIVKRARLDADGNGIEEYLALRKYSGNMRNWTRYQMFAWRFYDRNEAVEEIDDPADLEQTMRILLLVPKKKRKR